MKKRCLNPRAKQFEDYGGRGITVCDRWINSFENFFADVGPRPSPEHSIDRIDNDGNYELGNVRWATAFEQAANNRRNVSITVDGETLPASEWARRTGTNVYTIYDRLDAGWNPQRAVTEPPRKWPAAT